jgi:hypothetical protein
MPSSNRSFDTCDFVQAWLSRRQYRNAHADLKSYHEAALAAFSKAFGIDLDVSPESKDGHQDGGGLHGLFLQVARRYESLESPFSDYLCAPREIADMYQQFGGPVEEALGTLRRLYLSMMAGLVERIWGQDASRQLSQEELEACGHPGWSAPDPLDYW